MDSQQIKTGNIFLKRKYNEVAEDIVDMSNVRIFKEVEKRKMWDVYTLVCLLSAELSKAFGLFLNICSDTSIVQGCWNLSKTL